MKSQKGITLTALVVYIVVFMIILTIMTIITNGFFTNISGIKEPIDGIAEFNKFSMLFINDVKKNDDCTIENNQIEFADGTIYTYNETEQAIYRNDLKIAKYVNKVVFTNLEHTEEIEGSEFTKKIINVNMIVGRKNELIKRDIDFVLKYW